MNQIPNQAQKNPLAGWYRQPKIYVRLPSLGRFYTQNALDRSSTDEYAVYSMTAKDDLMFKTPDALLTGQSTVEVIKSCFPAILEPWDMPSIDLDFVLIAIRIATHGDKMDVDCKCPKCESENTYGISLQPWLDMFANFQYNDTVNVDPLIIKIRPYSYKEVTKISLRGMEQQKMFNVINDEELDDEAKLEKFGINYKALVNKRWVSLPPSETCEYPDKISMEPGGKLTPGHYGCYLAHKDAFYRGLNDNVDYILIFEFYV
jgi:hypothetical protein